MTSSTEDVVVTATHVVPSEHPISLQDPFVLGPLDQLGHFATPINAVWIYESSSVSLVPVEKLRKAISRLLDYYPHLTGRLCVDNSTGVRSVNRLGTGMHLVEASCKSPLRSFTPCSSTSSRRFSVFDLPGSGNALLAPWDMSLEGAQREPVFTIQRTVFACSAVAIGMRLSHVVGGAGSFLRLYQDLAEIYRVIDAAAIEGLIELTMPPHLAPFMVTEMTHMDTDEKNEALSKQPAAYSLTGHKPVATAPTKNEAQSQQALSEDQVVGRSLRFSPSALATLKRLAVDPGDSSSRVSAFTAFTAHFWQRTHLSRLSPAVPYSSETSVYSSSMYGTSVDFAPHLGLPEHSFGNTIVTPIVELPSAKLEKAPLWEVAKIINGLVRHVSLDETRQLGRWIAAQPQKWRIQLDFKCTPTSFITTGWHHFPLYSGTVLEASPTFATPVPMESLFDGMVLFVEPKAKDGGIEAIVSLRASTWALLDADEEFITAWDKGE